ERGALEVQSVDGKRRISIPLGNDDLAQTVALDQTGVRLAVAVRTIRRDAPFVRDDEVRVDLFDLSGGSPRPTAGPVLTAYAEAFAFHPDGKHLAIAGGNDDEVTLWDISSTPPRLDGEARGVGSGLWGVALSADSSRLGFRTRRQPV